MRHKHATVTAAAAGRSTSLAQAGWARSRPHYNGAECMHSRGKHAEKRGWGGAMAAGPNGTTQVTAWTQRQQTTAYCSTAPLTSGLQPYSWPQGPEVCWGRSCRRWQRGRSSPEHSTHLSAPPPPCHSACACIQKLRAERARGPWLLSGYEGLCVEGSPRSRSRVDAVHSL